MLNFSTFFYLQLYAQVPLHLYGATGNQSNVLIHLKVLIKTFLFRFSAVTYFPTILGYTTTLRFPFVKKLPFQTPF